METGGEPCYFFRGQQYGTERQGAGVHAGIPGGGVACRSTESADGGSELYRPASGRKADPAGAGADELHERALLL